MDFSGLKKNLRKDIRGLTVIKVAVLCNFASQLLVEALKGHGIEEGINYEIFEADYDQIERQILDHSSEFYEYKPQFAIILRESEKLLLNSIRPLRKKKWILLKNRLNMLNIFTMQY